MRNKTTGFTLVELMVTLAVAIVMLAVGMPMYQGMTSNNRSVTVYNGLSVATKLARSEAVRRGETVSLCPKANAAQTNPSSMACGGSAASWANGWIVFTDEDGATKGTYEPASEELLRAWEAPTGTVSITSTDSTIVIAYDSSGELDTDVHSTTPISESLAVTVTGCKGNQVRTMTVTAIGRAVLTKSACP